MNEPNRGSKPRARFGRSRAAAAVIATGLAAFGGAFLATFETPANPQGAELAAAAVPNPDNEIRCRELYDPVQQADEIEQAVYDLTGNFATQFMCDPKLYNDGTWSSLGELKGYVAYTLDSCRRLLPDGSDPDELGDLSGLTVVESRNLTQAIIERTRVVPESANLCKPPPYEARDNQMNTHKDWVIEWGFYKKSPGYQKTNAFNAVQQVLGMCGGKRLFPLAIVEVTGQIPDFKEAQWAAYPGTSIQSSGQCRETIFNHAQFYSYKTAISNPGVKSPRGLLEFVRDRAASQATCPNSQITQAFQELTGWNPVVNDYVDECDPRRYGYGSWTSYAELKRLVAASFDCNDPWINQVYWFLPTNPRNVRSTGGEISECSPALYGNGYHGSGTYEQFAAKVKAAKSALEQNKLTFDGSGDLTVGNQFVTYTLQEGHVWMSANGVHYFDAAGNIISDKGLGIVSDAGAGLRSVSAGGSPVIAAGGGNVIAAGGGNVISLGSGNVIAAGGGNVIAAGALNLISNSANGVIPQGGLNIAGFYGGG